MNRTAVWIAVFVVGGVVGWLVGQNPDWGAKRQQRTHSGRKMVVDYSNEITVRRGYEETLILSPYCIFKDGNSERVRETSPDDEKWVISIDNGKIQIACTPQAP